MHLVLRSSKATGDWSFKKRAHERKIVELLNKFSRRHGVHVYNLANVGNHLHFHIKLSRRHSYFRFIRALTAAIAMAVTGSSRWNPLKSKFWDHRPFTRIVQGYRQFLTLKNYININIFEGMGFPRSHARLVLSEFMRP
jgi:REP element-mobilizing transposase RayT